MRNENSFVRTFSRLFDLGFGAERRPLATVFVALSRLFVSLQFHRQIRNVGQRLFASPLSSRTELERMDAQQSLFHWPNERIVSGDVRLTARPNDLFPQEFLSRRSETFSVRFRRIFSSTSLDELFGRAFSPFSSQFLVKTCSFSPKKRFIRSNRRNEKRFSECSSRTVYSIACKTPLIRFEVICPFSSVVSIVCPFSSILDEREKFSSTFAFASLLCDRYGSTADVSR